MEFDLKTDFFFLTSFWQSLFSSEQVWLISACLSFLFLNAARLIAVYSDGIGLHSAMPMLLRFVGNSLIIVFDLKCTEI